MRLGFLISFQARIRTEHLCIPSDWMNKVYRQSLSRNLPSVIRRNADKGVDLL
jgi:hypothetical protein